MVEERDTDLPPLQALLDFEPGRFLVYVLRLGEQRFYVGLTTNLSRRLTQHLAGLGASATVGVSIESIEQVVVCKRAFDAYRTEWAKFFEFARQYGWKQVRGAGYVRFPFPGVVRELLASGAPYEILRRALQAAPQALTREELVALVRAPVNSSARMESLRGTPLARIGRMLSVRQWNDIISTACRRLLLTDDGLGRFRWVGPQVVSFASSAQVPGEMELASSLEALVQRSHPKILLPKPIGRPKKVRSWHEADRQKVLALWNAGAFIEEIARELKRSPRAIEAQLARMLPPVEELLKESEEPAAFGD